MARGKTTFRMTTVHTPRHDKSVALNRDGSIQRDPVKDRIQKLKSKFMKAKKMMKESLEIMNEVEQEFLNLEKTNFQDVDEILKDN